MAEANIPSQELLSRKFDRSLSNFLTKSAIGLAVGITFSVVLFKRALSLLLRFFEDLNLVYLAGKTWPIAFATGFASGIAFAESEQLYSVPKLVGYNLVAATEKQ